MGPGIRPVEIDTRGRQPGNGERRYVGKGRRRSRILSSGDRRLMMAVRIQTENFDAGAEMAAMRKGNSAIGAIASFVGVVRDVNEGDSVSDMTLEHYPGMTEKSIE